MMDEDGTKMVTGLPPLAAAPLPPDEEGGETKARAETCKTRLDAEDIVFGLFWFGSVKEVVGLSTNKEQSSPPYQIMTVIVASKPL